MFLVIIIKIMSVILISMYLSESQVNDYEENCLVNSNLSKHPTQAQSLKQFKTLGDLSTREKKKESQKLFSISSQASPK